MLLKCKNGDYELTPALLDSYRLLYPTADTAFAEMLIWLENNAARRPASAKSAPRFVANWFRNVRKARPVTPAQEKIATLHTLMGGRQDVIEGDFRNVENVRRIG